MDVDGFREFGKAAVDYIADYFDHIREKKVLSKMEPGYLEKELPNHTPLNGESWRKVMEDIDKVIIPGLTHWHSPQFHAYMPTANSFPGIVGELLSSGLGGVSKDWLSNPASVELELRMMDWLAKMLGLPEFFLNGSEGSGGGIIQNAASESTLVALLCGKRRTVSRIKKQNSDLSEAEIVQKLVAYTSEQSNSSVEKAGLLASVAMRLLSTDEGGSLRGETLSEAIEEDKAKGLHPCCVIATLGTTGTCGYDNLEELGPVCQKDNIWLHIDAAYTGSVFACPEYRYIMKGIEHADSFNFNPHKWLLINSDCSAMWFKNTREAENTFKVGKEEDDKNTPNISNYQIPNTRRFRALKIWFVLRIYGVQGIQNHIRKQLGLAHYFEELASKDERFEVCSSRMGVVCFRLKMEDCVNQLLLDRITKRGNIFMIPCFYNKLFVIRFVVCSRFTEICDVDYAWKEITSQAEELLLHISKPKV